MEVIHWTRTDSNENVFQWKHSIVHSTQFGALLSRSHCCETHSVNKSIYQSRFYNNDTKRVFYTCTLQKTQKQSSWCTLARSLIVSVFPIPSGPTGTPHWQDLSAMVRVRKHLWVKGVTTRCGVGPRYSYPYTKLVPSWCTLQRPSSYKCLMGIIEGPDGTCSSPW